MIAFESPNYEHLMASNVKPQPKILNKKEMQHLYQTPSVQSKNKLSTVYPTSFLFEQCQISMVVNLFLT